LGFLSNVVLSCAPVGRIQNPKDNTMKTGNTGGKSGTPMTQSAASRIQSATAKASGGQVQSGSFAARAQSAAALNTPVQGGKK
jgi:hypothetical protein